MFYVISLGLYKFVSERIALSQIEITFALFVTCSCVTTPGNSNVHEDVHVFEEHGELVCVKLSNHRSLVIVRASESGQLTTIVKTGHEEI